LPEQHEVVEIELHHLGIGNRDKSMHRLALALVSMLAFISAITCPAQADEPWNFAQITCVPELGYFSIRKILIMNLPHKGLFLSEGLTASPSVVNALQSKYRIFDSEGLSGHPFTCTSAHLDAVPGWEREREGFEVKVIGHIDHEKNNEETSYCRMIDSAEVIVNGKSVGSIVLNPCEDGPMLVGVEVAHDGVELGVRRCTHDPFADKAADQEQVVCREEPLSKAQ
jgi:hypothetical protein